MDLDGASVPSTGDDGMDIDPGDPPTTSDANMGDADAQDPHPSSSVHPMVQSEEDGDYFEEPYPPERRAGATYGPSKTAFEHIRDDQVLTGCEVLGPFADEEEWNLAKWLIKNVGHNQTESFLKLPIITDRVRPSFDKKRTFLENIDSLPIGPEWNIKHIPLVGDLCDDDGKSRTETAELWYRDPVECVKELIGNPAFRDVMDYAPTRLFLDAEGTEELIEEMSSAGWWWKMQTRLPDGTTCAPIILSSDKTQLSQQRGDKTAWPVYLTIGNIAKDTRRKASSHATVLLGYLPTAKLDCFSDAGRSVAKYRLFHYCMGLIMHSLAEAGTNGVQMTCADGLLRNVHPILAAYVADYPEHPDVPAGIPVSNPKQCLVACCMENRCPICKVLPTERGDHTLHPKRDMDEALSYINRFETGRKDAQFKAEFASLGLRPVQPFWAGLPHSDIFEAFTPDILHQLHKGAFKESQGPSCFVEMDARFKSMPSHPDVRHFKHGISLVSKWTGGEHKEMEKVFARLMAGHAKPKVIRTATTVINFISLSSLESHTTTSLAALDTALDAPERLHIDYAKAGYRASNKKDYIAQMTLWLQRQEAVDSFTAYLAWCADSLRLKPYSTIPPPPPAPPTTAGESAEISRVSSAPPPGPASSSAALTTTYKIAQSHPSELHNIPVSSITDKAGCNAQQFLPALTLFLRKHHSHFIPQNFDRFDLYKRITITLPSIRQTSNLKLRNVVRASPPVAAVAGTRKHGERAYQDFALVRTGEVNAVTDGTALEGLRVAQVRVLFKFPSYYPAPFNTAKPLAYVEWFTPFSRPEVVSGLFIVHRSSRNHRPYAELIELDRIARNCFLVP
ncbi:hypothetical protein B0H15DRAFT_920171 [Mycena belliarum]|uniref:Uncharacterized protein n=1 Tax=Mycena belliarum TaxID=1033014 RepID=A0AAD6UCN8_9AGAR|nr:hypothetical protein B0H15DRAFT_920171 [Mycena belliae]